MKTYVKKHVFVMVFAAFVVALAAGSTALAQDAFIADTPTLPPDGVYLTPQDVHARYGHDPAVLDIILSQIKHKPFADTAVVERVGADEKHTFDSSLTAMADITIGGTHYGVMLLELTGPVVTIARNKTDPNATGTWATEILSMDLVGSTPFGPVRVRENPDTLLQSTGQTTITSLGAGKWAVDSFFDVFTELSLDGGTSWIPATDSTLIPVPARVELQPNTTIVPEPGAAALLLTGLGGLARLKRRR